jgi:hypothetical protein
MYRQLLDRAYGIGLADGSFAVDFEPASAVDVVPTSSRGRSGEELARLLWADRPGGPPAGLEANAPLWYARGFTDGLELCRSLAARGPLGAGERERAP